MRTLTAFFASLLLAACALTGEQSKQDVANPDVGSAGLKEQPAKAETDPRAVVAGWLTLIENEEYGKYIDAALDPDGVFDRATMIVDIGMKKQFLLAILKAMKDGTPTITEDGDNRIATFTFAKETEGCCAASLKWVRQRWIYFKTYRTGQPIK